MSTTLAGSRIVGIDVARCVALLAMMAVHVLPAYEPGTQDVTLVREATWGRAAALFAVLAGVGLALTSGGRVPLRGRPLGAAAGGVVVRAILIALVGLGLGEVDSGLAVILTYYGAVFLLAVPFLGLRPRTLLGLAAVWAVAAPVLSQLLRREIAVPPKTVPSFESLGEPLAMLTDLTFTGYYPAVPWVAYLLVGMALGRSDLRSAWLPAYLVAFGGGLALLSVAVSDLLTRRPEAMATFLRTYGTPEDVRTALASSAYGTLPTDSWWWLVTQPPHSTTPFDLAQTIGVACAAIGICLVVGRLAPRTSAVLFGAGAMTLTLYSLHVFLVAEVWEGATTSTYLRQAATVVVIGAVFALLRWRGPLEWVVAAASNRVRRTLS